LLWRHANRHVNAELQRRRHLEQTPGARQWHRRTPRTQHEQQFAIARLNMLSEQRFSREINDDDNNDEDLDDATTKTRRRRRL